MSRPAGALHEGVTRWLSDYLYNLLIECSRREDQTIAAATARSRPIAAPSTHASASTWTGTVIPDVTLICTLYHYTVTLALAEIAFSQTARNVIKKVRATDLQNTETKRNSDDPLGGSLPHRRP